LEEIKELEIMYYLDVLVDGEFEIDKIDLQAKWRGSINQRVIDVPQTLKLGQIVLACD
jgi:anaerobic ribonucleoside-triphosphate reductase activating protein